MGWGEVAEASVGCWNENILQGVLPGYCSQQQRQGKCHGVKGQEKTRHLEGRERALASS